MRDTLLQKAQTARLTSLDGVGQHIELRRWRILRAALPDRHVLSKRPLWVETPEEFLWWLAAELEQQALRTYLKDLELIAKQTCDLVLLRLARDAWGRWT